MSGTLDPRLIEQEIGRIRERESNPYSSGIKTNLFTLLIFRAATVRTGGGRAAGGDDPTAAALQYLLGKRPARIITIERTAAPRTEAVVSGRCFPDRRNRGVCFEEVRIASGDDGLGADPGAWAPLLIRDLPVYAWWPEGLPVHADPGYDALLGAAGLIDKLIVDTARAAQSAADPVAPLRALRLLRARTAAAFPVSDFAWHRGRVLRELTARAFDLPETRRLLTAIRSVRLDAGFRGEALLFFLWLSARLGWAPTSPKAALPSFRDPHGREVSVDYPGDDTSDGKPLSDGFRLVFSFEGAPDLEIGCTRGGCVSSGTEKGAYRFPSDGEILLVEVDTLPADALFQEVLDHAGNLLA